MNLVRVFEIEITNQGKNKGYTWSSGERKSNIDYFLFKRNYTFLNIECVDNISNSISDHYFKISKMK
jgi:hypothetical protein